jgi:hypothetical protein
VNTLTIKTVSGSTYVVDQEKKVWSRPVHALTSNNVRTKDGAYINMSAPRVGSVLVFHCPPLVPGTAGRVIVTTPVVSIEGEID